MTPNTAGDKPIRCCNRFVKPARFCALVAIGANISGKFGVPLASLRQGVSRLEACGMALLAASGLYETAPVGRGRQPRYLNAVLLLRTSLTPAQLLRLFKRIEQQAGRRRQRPNAPRPLDLDLIACDGRHVGWRPRATKLGTRAGANISRRSTTDTRG